MGEEPKKLQKMLKSKKCYSWLFCLILGKVEFGRNIADQLCNLFITVKLGFNDHAYNEFTVITNKFNPIIRSQMTVLLHKSSRYNDVTAITNRSHGPVEFVI